MNANLLETIAGKFNLSASDLTPISGGHTIHVYEYSKDNKPFILRITPPGTNIDIHATLSTLEWLVFLSQHNGPVSLPVCSRNEKLIEEIEFDGQVWIAGAFEKAPGELAEGVAPESWSDEMFEALGSAVGRCHCIAKDYRPTPALRRPEWDVAFNYFNPVDLMDGAEPWLLEKRLALLNPILALPKDLESYGLAHMDLHFGNFFVDQDTRRITLFDFDDCAYGWYIMDIAMLILDVLVVYQGENVEKFGEQFTRHLFRGYRSEKEMDLFWILKLPELIKLLEIGIYLELYRDYDPDEPGEWVRKFMTGRKERIAGNQPYVDLDFSKIYTASGHSSPVPY